MLGSDEILAGFHSKHDLIVNLRVGVRRARTIPLLTELGNVFVRSVLQRYRP
jgi:hypothetical protein